MNKTEANCFCFKGYSGLNCEIVSVEMQANKRNIQIIVAISITLFVCFVILIICLDILGYHIKNKEAFKPKKTTKLNAER